MLEAYILRVTEKLEKEPAIMLSVEISIWHITSYPNQTN